jgi:hypothetical protein
VNDRRQELRDISGGHERDRRFVWYALSDRDLDPDEITMLTGIRPDASYRAEDTIWVIVPSVRPGRSGPSPSV